MEEEKTNEYCYHNYELSRVVNEPSNNANSTGETKLFYDRVGYSVCTKCGKIKRSKV